MRRITANVSQPNQKKFMTVGDIALSRRRLTFGPEEYVRIVMPLMLSSDGGAAGVVDEEGELIGLLTDRTILRQIFFVVSDPAIHPHNVGKRIDDMTVAEAMVAFPETLTEDIDIEDALGMMIRRGFRYMPVVSKYDKGELIGIVSERELALHVQHRLCDVKKSEAESRSLLTYLMHEPYSSGYQQPS